MNNDGKNKLAEVYVKPEVDIRVMKTFIIKHKKLIRPRNKK